MKILVLTPFVPDPEAAAGCPRAVFDRLTLLAAEHDVTVLTPPSPESSGAAVRALGVELVTAPISPPPPRWWRRAAKRLSLAAGLLRRGRPMLVQEFDSVRLRRRLRLLLSERAFDVVLIEHLLMAQQLEVTGPNLRAVVSDHDVHFAFPDAVERPSRASRLRSIIEARDRRRWQVYAAAAYRRAAAVLVPTQEDADWLTTRVAGIQPVVARFGVVPAPRASGRPAQARRNDVVLFVGNFAHLPNRDAAGWLVETIMPIVRRTHPDVTACLVGKDPTDDVLRLAGDGVEVIGDVPEVAPYLETCTLFVAPLRRGGGTRVKVLEAFVAGTAVVSTSRGIAGTLAVAGRDVLVADTAEDFAAAVVLVLGSGDLREALGAHAAMLVDDPAARLEILERALGAR